MERESKIIRTSLVGIIVNALLAAFKAFVGTITGSIAITMDAVNNATDALSSVITILGTKLSTKKPDREHPYGYGRIEYLSGMVISVIVLYAGITAFMESAEKIIEPEVPDYTTISLIIVAVAVVVKILLGLYFKKVGKNVNSKSLIASGEDALMDSIVSASTLVAAFIFIYLDISLEAWLGAVIAILVIRTGVDLLRDTLSDILGRRVSSEESLAVKETVNSFDEVLGAYDLTLHSYGPETMLGSIHIEVREDMDAKSIDKLEREIFNAVYCKHRIIMTAIGIYSSNTKDEVCMEIQDGIREIIAAHKDVIQLHGLFIDREEKTILFDIILSFDCEDMNGELLSIRQEVSDRYPDYQVAITLDVDVSD